MSAGSVFSVLGWPEALPAARPPAPRLGERMSGREPCESRCLGPGGLPGAEPPEEEGSPGREPCDGAEMQLKVDFFRKLGYSSEEIHVVLQKLGLNADTNTVLGELVKHGPAERESAEAPPEAKEAPLVPRGGAANKTPAPAPAPEETESENLKPIVIDGSNVAMRCVWGFWPGVGRGARCGGPARRWVLLPDPRLRGLPRAWGLKTLGGFSLQTAGCPASGRWCLPRHLTRMHSSREDERRVHGCRLP